MFILGRVLQGLGLIVSGLGLVVGLGFGPLDSTGQGDLGAEVFLFGIGLGLFMLGLVIARKAGPPQ